MCLGFKITGHKNISVQEKFRLEQGPLKTGFPVYTYRQAGRQAGSSIRNNSLHGLTLTKAFDVRFDGTWGFLIRYSKCSSALTHRRINIFLDYF
jgi:hypothetical protein